MSRCGRVTSASAFRVELSLRQIPVVDEAGGPVVRSWTEIVDGEKEVAGIFAVKSVAAIVASQDCDNLRSPDITLCEIGRFQEIERKSRDTSSPKKWKDIITQHSRINQKWFYLPPDSRIGFENKMAVNFLVTIRLPRAELETMRHLRKGRLNATADEHFRERISEFFRRYPYDEWYALDSSELAAYQHDYPDAKPFPWQQTKDAS